MDPRRLKDTLRVPGDKVRTRALSLLPLGLLSCLHVPDSPVPNLGSAPHTAGLQVQAQVAVRLMAPAPSGGSCPQLCLELTAGSYLSLHL